MPIAKITFICRQCGQEYIRRLTANTNRDASWLKENLSGDSSRLCPDCYAAEQKRKNEELVQQILTTHKLVLADLEGSAKQIAYAENLRTQKLIFLSTCIIPTQHELLQKNVRTVLTALTVGLANETSAKAIIENEQAFSDQSIKLFLKQIFVVDEDTGQVKIVDHNQLRKVEQSSHLFNYVSDCSNLFDEYKQYKKLKQLEIKALPRPSRPPFLDGKWNETIYGKNTIYVDSRKVQLTSEQVTELKDYQKSMEKYKKEKNRLLNEDF